MLGSETAPDHVPSGEQTGPAGGFDRLRSAQRDFARRIDWSAYGIIIATLAIWCLFNVASGGLFLSPRNLTLLMVQGVVLATIACGVTLIMVMGHIDLSVASTVGLSAVVAAYLQAQAGWGTAPTIAVVLLVGLVIGAWQGFWVAYVGIPAFIVTLAGLSIFRGLAFVINSGMTFAPMAPNFVLIASGSLDKVLSVALIILGAGAYLFMVVRSAGDGRRDRSPGRAFASAVGRALPVLAVLAIVGYVGVSYEGIPFPILIVVAEVLLLTFVAQRTRFGRHLYAIGGNREAAILAGVNVARHTFVAFVGMGFLYGLGGIVVAARLNGAPADPVIGMELDVITACIIGGTSLFGGVGTVVGAILGALLLTSLSNGMDLLGFSTYAQFIVKGMVLLFAVCLDVFLKRRRIA